MFLGEFSPRDLVKFQLGEFSPRDLVKFQLSNFANGLSQIFNENSPFSGEWHILSRIDRNDIRDDGKAKIGNFWRQKLKIQKKIFEFFFLLYLTQNPILRRKKLAAFFD